MWTIPANQIWTFFDISIPHPDINNTKNYQIYPECDDAAFSYMTRSQAEKRKMEKPKK